MITFNIMIKRIVFSTIILFASILLQAQSDKQLNLFNKDTSGIINEIILNDFSTSEMFILKETFHLNNDFNSIFPEHNTFNFNKVPPIKNLSFSQQKTMSEMHGLGTSEWMNNRVFLQAGEKLTLGFEGGLAIQNTFINPWIPNYQYTLGVSVSFTVNNNLDAYFFGRYISAPSNKPGDYFDPFMYNNPLFLQSGTGAGLKSNLKNTIVDFQIMSGYDHQLKIMNNFNSKLQIRF